MEAIKVKLSSKGQIAIPVKFRKSLKSDYVEIIQQGNHLIVREAPSVDELAGSLGKYVLNKSTIKEKDAWTEHVRDKHGSD